MGFNVSSVVFEAAVLVAAAALLVVTLRVLRH